MWEVWQVMFSVILCMVFCDHPCYINRQRYFDIYYCHLLPVWMFDSGQVSTWAWFVGNVRTSGAECPTFGLFSLTEAAWLQQAPNHSLDVAEWLVGGYDALFSSWLSRHHSVGSPCLCLIADINYSRITLYQSTQSAQVVWFCQKELCVQ